MDINVILLVLFIIVILCLVIYFKKRKRLELGGVTLITGGVKSGKSSLSVGLSIKEYKKAYRKWFIKSLFNKSYEKPLFYSNTPIYIPCDLWHLLKHDYLKIKHKKIVGYIPVTNDVLDRKTRLAYGSICYLGEFSLVADSMSGSVVGTKEQKEFSMELAERLSLFIKLYGHETGGQTVINGKKVKSIGCGKCICDTQALADVHFGLRRNVAKAIYIERSIKWIPFFMLFKVRELIYIDEHSATNTFNNDIEDANLKWYIMLKPWKYFDYCCYSVFTDNLHVENTCEYIGKFDNKKVKKLPSFRNFKSIDLDCEGNIKNVEK